MQVAGVIKRADIIDACCVRSAITQDADHPSFPLLLLSNRILCHRP